jgi:hypothetical protein
MPGIDDVDFTSDLNGAGDLDVTVGVNDGNLPSQGQDALQLNNQKPLTPVQQPTQVKEPVAADKPLSIRDQISRALKGAEQTPPVAQQDGRPRNPDGTFAPVAAAPVAAPVDPNAPAAAPVVAAPQGFDPEVFKSLPAETQQYVARTMDGVNAQQQRFARLESVEQAITPERMNAWAISGMAPAQALGQLLALSDFAGRDPAGFIKYMAENNGVDLEELVLGQEPVDPQYKALQDELAQMRAHIDGQAQQQLQNQHNQTVNGVVAFASEKGQDGNLLRPYFDELGSEVLPFISAVKAQNPNMPHNQVLQEAYDRACWGTPSVRAKMQAAANAAGDAERLRSGVDKVERARTASVSVANGTPSAAPTPPNDASRSLRDTIRASMAAASQ